MQPRLAAITTELAQIAARRNALYAAGHRNPAGPARSEPLRRKLDELWSTQSALNLRAMMLAELQTEYLAAIRAAEQLDKRRAENPVNFAAVDRCQQNLARTMRGIEDLERMLAEHDGAQIQHAAE